MSKKENVIVCLVDTSIELMIVGIVNDGSGTGIVTRSAIWSEPKDPRTRSLVNGIEQAWTHPQFEQESASGQSIMLIIGERAGFTDSRTAFMWVKTRAMMEGLVYSVIKSPQVTDLSSIDDTLMATLIVEARDTPHTSLEYAAEPRIGKR